MRSVDDTPSVEFCYCANMRSGGDFGFTRDPDTGWWVHAACRRPTKAWYTAQVAQH